MAGILDTFNLFPTRAQDVVGIYRGENGNLEQIFVQARPRLANVKEESQFMAHPVEDGTSITDHRIIQPIEIEIPFVISRNRYLDTYNEIKQTYFRGESLSIRTRTGLYSNMYIVRIPHREDPDMYDAISISITFREVQFVQAQFSALPPNKVVDKKNSSTVPRGTQTPKSTNEAQTAKSSSTLFEVFN